MIPIRDLRARLEELLDDAMRKIKDSVEFKDVRGVTHHASLIERCEKALNQLDALEKTAVDIERLLKSGPNALPHEEPPFPALDKPFKAPPRAVGTLIRENWVKGLVGKKKIKLKKLRGPRYETPDRRLIGIAFASELKRKPGAKPEVAKWFLSLPKEEFDVMVLLCETRRGELLDFVIPTYEMKDVLLQITYQKQIKINIQRKEDGEHYIIAKDLKPKPIGMYLGKYGFVEGKGPLI